MNVHWKHGIVSPASVAGLLWTTGCGRAPSFDIMGSFFPAWLVCFMVSILLTAIARALLSRYVEIAWPVLVYPRLTAPMATLPATFNRTFSIPEKN